MDDIRVNHIQVHTLYDEYYMIASVGTDKNKILGPPVPGRIDDKTVALATKLLLDYMTGRITHAFDMFVDGADLIRARESWYDLTCYVQEHISKHYKT